MFTLRVPRCRPLRDTEQVGYTNQPSAIGILENDDFLNCVLPAMPAKPTKTLLKVVELCRLGRQLNCFYPVGCGGRRPPNLGGLGAGAPSKLTLFFNTRVFESFGVVGVRGVQRPRTNGFRSDFEPVGITRGRGPW